MVVGVVFFPVPLHLQVQKEAFHYRFISAVALAVHATNQSVFLQQLLMKRAGVLGSPVEMQLALKILPDFFGIHCCRYLGSKIYRCVFLN